jgi:hypothetical protein
MIYFLRCSRESEVTSAIPLSRLVTKSAPDASGSPPAKENSLTQFVSDTIGD